VARFSQTFLQGLLQPTYQQGLFEAAKGLGQTPGIMRIQQQQKEEKERIEKGILGGTMAVQKAAQAGTLDEQMLREYAGSMQGLGMSTEDILKSVNTLQSTNQQAAQQNKTKNFVESLGEDYAAQYAAGIDLKSVYSQFLSDTQQKSIADLAVSIDPTLDPELAGQMSGSDLVRLYENKKETNGARVWAEWINKNSEINDDNRASAVQAAASAFGAEAPKKVADLEAVQLNNKSKKEGKKSVPVIITMKESSAFAGIDLMGGPKQQITTKNLPVNPDGTLSDAAEKWLEAHASSAMVQDTGEKWKPKSNTESKDNIILGGNTPSGQGGEGSTLGQIIGPAALEQALTNLEF